MVQGSVVSGIAGIVLPGGQVVDERLLRRMAASLTYRGPDDVQTWNAGPIGFAHALLQTSETPPGPQPATLDHCVWITADARVDGRSELVRKLEAAGRKHVSPSDDSRLILHAYHVWGADCVEHLLGDFAFAIWDARSKRVFCARDQFGVKPFYYAEVDGGIVFSNTLDCVRLHPGVGDALNELSVADFLLFGFNQDTTATAFERIRRLPPAHAMIGAADATRVRRYWAMPTDGRIRYRRSGDYIDHFIEVLRAAVDDRIRVNRPAVWMSGGLDSTAVAATAQRVLAGRGAPFDLRAHTVVFDTLIPDHERRFAADAARAIGLTPHYVAADASPPFDGWRQPGFRTPEPIDEPYYVPRQLQELGADTRTVLVGDGGDEVFWRSCVVDLVGAIPLLQLGADMARCVLLHRSRPAVGVRAKLAAWRGIARVPAPPPVWLNEDFVARWDLRHRVALAATPPQPTHTLRPDAYRRLSSPAWPAYLESVDPGVTRVLVEHQWPFLDVRLVSFLMAVPPLPWCVDKRLLRVAMRGSLPDALLRRPKSPLAADPLRAHLQMIDCSWLDRFDPSPQLARFVNRAAIPPIVSAASSQNPWLDLRPFCLNYWLSRVNDHAS
jgi:asparagine synthase (glutamine-hydrolysing)